MTHRTRHLAQAIARCAAKRYVVGSDVRDAMEMCRLLAARRFTSTICAWNDTQSSAEDNAERCLLGIQAVAAERLDCYVSLKALDVRYSMPLLERIAARARQCEVGLHFDSMECESADQTFEILRLLSNSGVKLGCTIPGRWRRSVADAEYATEMGFRVRVVKGQWADPDDPALDLRAGFTRVIDRLAGRARQVAVATHDPELARAALDRLSGTGTETELELLFGMPFREMIPLGRAASVPIRIYLPYGHAWLPYALRQAIRKPSIAWWTVRDMVTGGTADPRRILGI